MRARRRTSPCGAAAVAGDRPDSAEHRSTHWPTAQLHPERRRRQRRTEGIASGARRLRAAPGPLVAATLRRSRRSGRRHTDGAAEWATHMAHAGADPEWQPCMPTGLRRSSTSAGVRANHYHRQAAQTPGCQELVASSCDSPTVCSASVRICRVSEWSGRSGCSRSLTRKLERISEPMCVKERSRRACHVASRSRPHPGGREPPGALAACRGRRRLGRRGRERWRSGPGRQRHLVAGAIATISRRLVDVRVSTKGWWPHRERIARVERSCMRVWECARACECTLHVVLDSEHLVGQLLWADSIGDRWGSGPKSGGRGSLGNLRSRLGCARTSTPPQLRIPTLARVVARLVRLCCVAGPPLWGSPAGLLQSETASQPHFASVVDAQAFPPPPPASPRAASSPPQRHTERAPGRLHRRGRYLLRAQRAGRGARPPQDRLACGRGSVPRACLFVLKANSWVRGRPSLVVHPNSPTSRP